MRKKIRVLFLIANPSNTGFVTRLEWDPKMSAIRDELRDFRNLVFDSGSVASVDDLSSELEFYPSDIVHFIGYGTGQGIVLPSKAGDMDAISGDALARHFSRSSPRTRLVVLDGCYTLGQANALAKLVDCVLGINANNTFQFITTFYHHISGGRSIQDAFSQSEALMSSSTPPNLLGKKSKIVLLPPNHAVKGGTGQSGIGMGEDIEQNIKTDKLKQRRVFICYCNGDDDNKWLMRVQRYLEPLDCEGLNDPWDITKNPVDMELQDSVETAKVAILLVSAEFLAAAPVKNNQLPSLLLKAQAAGTSIIPLIVAPCAFKSSKLKEFLSFNPPDKSLEKMTRRVRWADVLVNLFNVVSDKL